MATPTNQADRLTGTASADAINGLGGNDAIYGKSGNDTLKGSNGNDTIHAGAGDDTLNGGEGKDTLYGDEGSDNLVGGNGDDSLWGGADNDTLSGGNGDDHLEGGAGDDRLIDEWGSDVLVGGAGADVYIIQAGKMTDGDANRLLGFDFSEGDSIWVRDIPGTTSQIKISSAEELKAFAKDYSSYATLVSDADGNPVSFNLSIGGATAGYELKPAETKSVYILAGQSNAERAEVRYSIEAALLEKGEDFVLVTEAHGGRTLFEKTYFADWNPNSQNEYFDWMNAQVALTIAEIEANGNVAEIKGLLWVQGEADAVAEVSANKYAANLQLLIDETRALYGKDFPFVVAELSSTHASMPFHETVRQAQEAVAASNENVVLLETGDLTFLPDGIHYDTPSKVALAEAFVEIASDTVLATPAVASDQVLTGTKGVDTPS